LSFQGTRRKKVKKSLERGRGEHPEAKEKKSGWDFKESTSTEKKGTPNDSRYQGGIKSAQELPKHSGEDVL